MTSERIRIGEEYYILASALAPRGRRLLLNDGDTFAIFDEAGDIPLASHDTVGLFCHGTRFLSRLELRVNETFPFLLSSGSAADGSEIVIYLTNPDERREAEIVLPRDSIALERRLALVDGAFSQQLRLHSYWPERTCVRLELLFAADFSDIFELRGVERGERGSLMPAIVDGDRVSFSYRGLDDVTRVAELTFSPDQWRLSADRACAEVRLRPGEQATLGLELRCRIDEATLPTRFDTALIHLRARRRSYGEAFPQLSSNNEAFNDWLQSSLRDLTVLMAEKPTGPYVYAGIPWFATVFGRDGLITALETLNFTPVLALGVLRGLAALQGREHDAARDEEPGKILHELREGEMAATGEVPFGRYYGSIDSTPLFLCLLVAFVQRAGDLSLARELWPAAVAAMDWIERNTAERGYLAYERHTATGLINQGWKDSHDSISHADGSLAEPPIALCEVQAYVYAARLGMSGLAQRLGHRAESQAWAAAAASLRERFERDFWMPEEECFALALDRHRQPCRIVTSNAGHCLLSGIASPAHAHAMMERLMRDDVFCGWGIRTLSAKERRYNPISYHNGSVWPHDTALVAAGFARCGRTHDAARILSGLFEASTWQDQRRLPELFCGFARAQTEQPVAYPVACRPQAWASASVFLLLQSSLGMEVDGWRRRISFSGATLPPSLDYLDIRGFRVDHASVDLRIRRGRLGTAIEIFDKSGNVEVVVRK